MDVSAQKQATTANGISGEFVTLMGERFYVIRNVDKLKPFLVSVVSSDDHWLFVSSTGGLTAGRVSCEKSLFPYITVDKIHESGPHTGSETLIRVRTESGQHQTWEPFGDILIDQESVTRNLYQNILANKLCFEEVHHELQLVFRYTWATSDSFGFIRQCELLNLGNEPATVELLDGLQNILPAGTPSHAQTNTSNLVNAYKWTELDAETGLAIYNLYSGISDRAEPCESLKANIVFCLGLEHSKLLISSNQLADFRRGRPLTKETCSRGVRGAYFANQVLVLAPGASKEWQIVADIEKTQSQVVELRHQLADRKTLAQSITRSIQQGSDELARLMASADAFQASAEEHVTSHHYANVLFNVLRGGIPNEQYTVSKRDFVRSVIHFNQQTYQRNKVFLDSLPEAVDINQLLEKIILNDDSQLERLCRDYLPITFGRRHGDPSRPWNQFTIKLKDANRARILFYEGNWRDIFQNWEALAFSYPEFIDNMIAKFLNASTMEGYNPYRITKDGIDWEVEDLDDPWSYIGYWGDHQIIYLSKLLELSTRFHPSRLQALFHNPVFSYANVPYRIKPFDELLEDPKNTVTYDAGLAQVIEDRVGSIGADGKLVMDTEGEVYQVNLIEKLLVPLLCKLCNLVVDGGIWMNTQRPEWNDANNALVGHGLSMVTLYYMRRHISLLQQILADENGVAELSVEVSDWLEDTSNAFSGIRQSLSAGPLSPAQRLESLNALGQAASNYQQNVYRDKPFSGKKPQATDTIHTLLRDSLAVIDASIESNRREDNLYHAYNLLEAGSGELNVQRLYLMLEGQVAVLSSGAIPHDEACEILEALFTSGLYRRDQDSFMLYPDRKLPGFLEKNCISSSDIDAIPLLRTMLNAQDYRIVERDLEDNYRFNADFRSARDLNERLDLTGAQYGDALEPARIPLQALFEKVFNHRTFTGRSGTMFGFEGLGSIYWHMVAKLLLAIQERFFAALDNNEPHETCERLGQMYYRVSEGLGFNKSPLQYGAFPAYPYSHTPGHAGARQPGMTGQVKEEILTRFGELGIRIDNGAVRFSPKLLRLREFATEPQDFRFLDIDGNWQSREVPAHGIAFTWCQVPVIYELGEDVEPSLTIVHDNQEQQTFPQLALDAKDSSELFRRSGRIRLLKLVFGKNHLLAESS